MNVFIGSWIVPLLFTIGLFVWISYKYGRAKDKGLLTIANAAKADLKGDKLTEVCALLLYLLFFSTLSLLAWLLWALFRGPLTCGT